MPNTTVSGVVQDIFTDDKGGRLNSPVYIIELDDGEQYEYGFNQPTCVVGDSVEFDSKDMYGSHRIQGAVRAPGSPTPAGTAPKQTAGPRFKKGATPAQGTPVKMPPYVTGNGYTIKQFPIPPLHPDRSIIRQNSLGHAVAISKPGASTEDIIKLAREFERYSCGDIEREAVEAARKGVATGDSTPPADAKKGRRKKSDSA